jgi:hypothetical protein
VPGYTRCRYTLCRCSPGLDGPVHPTPTHARSTSRPRHGRLHAPEPARAPFLLPPTRAAMRLHLSAPCYGLRCSTRVGGALWPLRTTSAQSWLERQTLDAYDSCALGSWPHPSPLRWPHRPAVGSGVRCGPLGSAESHVPVSRCAGQPRCHVTILEWAHSTEPRHAACGGSLTTRRRAPATASHPA